MDVSLVMFKSDGTRRDFALRKAKTVVGRTHACDLRIPLSSVSRTHCEIVMEHGDLFVRDLGSSNGTFVNDVRVKDEELEIGDQLTVGPVVFTIVINGKPEQVDPVHTFSQSTGQSESTSTGASGATGVSEIAAGVPEVSGVSGGGGGASAVVMSPAASAANRLSAMTAPQADQAKDATSPSASPQVSSQAQTQNQHDNQAGSPENHTASQTHQGDSAVKKDAGAQSPVDALEDDPIAALEAMASDDSDFSGEFMNISGNDNH